LAFSISLAIFQMSCTKTANSQTPSFTLTPATTSKLGGVMPDGTTISVDPNGKISTIGNTVQQEGKLLYGIYGATDAANAIWTANYDGTSPQKINVTLPSGLAIDISNLKISPDHKTIFFSVYTPNTNGVSGGYYIYACNMDGSNPHQIINGGTNGAAVGLAY
jgi:hypothetical protein